MNKRTKLLSIVLTLAMIVPMFSAFAVVGGADTVTYETAEVGQKLMDVDFRASDDYQPGFQNGKDEGEVDVSDDGTSVTIHVNKSKSVIWGAPLYPNLPAGEGYTYTIFFNVDVANGKKAQFGIYPDAYSGLIMIEGGNVRPQHSSSKESDGNNWRNKSDLAGNVRDFALEIDTETNAQALYAMNADGTYARADLGYTFQQGFKTEYLNCSLYLYSNDGTWANSYAIFSNVSVYKGTGFVENIQPREISETYFGQDVYDDAENGELLQTVQFRGTDWNPQYQDKNNCGTSVSYPNGGDGTAVQFRLNGASYSRSMWGNKLLNPLPYGDGIGYAFKFDLTLGNAGVGAGLMLDGDSTLVIGGDGSVKWYDWNAASNTATTTSEKWTSATDIAGMSQSFIVEMDWSANSYSLYVKRARGTYAHVATLTGDFTDSATQINLRFLVVKVGGTIDPSFTAKFENLEIYKGSGLVADGYFDLPFDDYEDGEILKKVTFNETSKWVPAMTSTYEDQIEATADGGSVTFTAIGENNSYNRGIWGDEFFPAYPLTAGAKYTFVYDVKFSSNNTYLGFYPDGSHGIVVKGNGDTALFQNGSKMMDYVQWGDKTDVSGYSQTFAVQFDFDANTFELFVEQMNGYFVSVFSTDDVTLDPELVLDTTSTNLQGYFFAQGKKVDNDDSTKSDYVKLSNFEIYKGLVDLTLNAAEREAIGLDTYEDADDGDVLKVVDFTESGWNPGFPSDSNVGADVLKQESNLVTLQIQDGNNYRAMWGNALTEALPLAAGVEYTFLFDLTFGNEYVGFAIYPDSNNGLVIFGDGTVRWYEWNTNKSTNSRKWVNYTDIAPDGKQTFAVVMNYSEKTYSLYVKNSFGAFTYVCTIQQDIDWSGATMDCILYVRSNDVYYDSDKGKNVYTAGDGYTATVENLNIIKGSETFLADNQMVLENVLGASVRVDDVVSGIRFTGTVDQYFYEEAVGKYGAENVKMGMMITPTDYLTDNKLAFTKAALDACDAITTATKYCDFEVETVLPEGNVYKMNCILSNVRVKNYARAFSAISYIEVKGKIIYGSYDQSNNSRSIAQVAAAALADVKAEADAEYQYEITVEDETMYSCYSAAQQATLAGYAAALDA